MFGYIYLKTSDYKSKQMPRKATAAKKDEKSQAKESTTNTEKAVAKTEKVEKTEKAPGRPAKTAKTAKDVAEKPVDKPVEVAKPTKAAKSKTEKPTEKTAAKEDEPELSDVEDVLDDSSNPKKRLVPTKESILGVFDELVASIDEEINRLRESSGKAKGVKFLRSLGKKVKTLRGYSVRVMKQKQRTNRKNNTNSGFLKPVHISSDMAKFTGWNTNDLKSRVDVTKYICKYIRDNNLQNPEDRRQIIADKKLTNLLGFNPDNDNKPLTYYRIQTYMKKHFTNPPTATSTTAVTK